MSRFIWDRLSHNGWIESCNEWPAFYAFYQNVSKMSTQLLWSWARGRYLPLILNSVPHKQRQNHTDNVSICFVRHSVNTMKTTNIFSLILSRIHMNIDTRSPWNGELQLVMNNLVSTCSIENVHALVVNFLPNCNGNTGQKSSEHKEPVYIHETTGPR